MKQKLRSKTCCAELCGKRKGYFGGSPYVQNCVCTACQLRAGNGATCTRVKA